jgi:hypothetical protein
LLRGPHCKQYTWFGYEGGLEARKSVVDERKRLEAARALESSVVDEKVDDITAIDKDREDISGTSTDVERDFETLSQRKRGDEESQHVE